MFQNNVQLIFINNVQLTFVNNDLKYLRITYLINRIPRKLTRNIKRMRIPINVQPQLIENIRYLNFRIQRSSDMFQIRFIFKKQQNSTDVQTKSTHPPTFESFKFIFNQICLFLCVNLFVRIHFLP